MGAKAIVQEFYQSDVLLDADKVNALLHPEVVLEWHSTKGFLKLNKAEIVELSNELSKAYIRSKSRISHIVSEGNTVAVRYAHFVKTIENPREEMMLAHFMVVWEVKDDKLYRGYQMSHL